MKYDPAGDARRDYALLAALPDNLDALRDAAGHVVDASDIAPDLKEVLRAGLRAPTTTTVPRRALMR